MIIHTSFDYIFSLKIRSNPIICCKSGEFNAVLLFSALPSDESYKSDVYSLILSLTPFNLSSLSSIPSFFQKSQCMFLKVSTFLSSIDALLNCVPLFIELNIEIFCIIFSCTPIFFRLSLTRNCGVLLPGDC